MASPPTQIPWPARKLPRKQRLILESLRSRIVSGELAPGERLPTQAQLASHFAVSNVTVQRTMDRLADEGFVRMRGRLGTFVTEQPPHLSRYGIVLYDAPGKPFTPFLNTVWREWSRLKDAGASEAYFHIRPDGDAGELARLTADIEADRLAGLVIIVPNVCGPALPGAVRRLPLVGCGGRTDVPGVAVIKMRSDQWMERAVTRVRADGRRRVAVITSAYQGESFIKEALRTIRHAGLQTRENWIQAGWPDYPIWGRRLTQLLLDRPADDHPDALLVTDDSLVDEVYAGVTESAVCPPDDLLLVAHANFPCPAQPLVPAVRLGFDVVALLRQAIALIDEQRSTGQPPERPSDLPVCFESELSSSHRARSARHRAVVESAAPA